MAEWKSLNRVIGGKISGMVLQAQLLQEITATVRGALPEDIAHHCQAERYDRQQLVVQVDDCSYATLIYFYQHDILKRVNQKFSRSLGCRFKKMRLLIRHGN